MQTHTDPRHAGHPALELLAASLLAALLALLLGAAVPIPARAAEASYFTRPVGSLADCHAAYAETAGRDVGDPRRFTVRHRADGGEHAYECLADGVTEYVCNVRAGMLAVAVHPGEATAACRRALPGLPLRHRQQWLPE